MPPRKPKGTHGKSMQVWAWLGVAGHAWSHPTKKRSLRCYLSWVDISRQKMKEIDAYFERYL